MIKSDRDDAIATCNEWIEWTILSHYLKELLYYVRDLCGLVLCLLPDTEDKVADPMACISYATDDILEMDSISEEDRGEEIRNMIAENKELVQDLARQLVEQIEINFQKYLHDAEVRGFERHTIRWILGKEEWED